MRSKRVLMFGWIAAIPLIAPIVCFGSLSKFAAWSRGEYIEATSWAPADFILQPGDRLVVPVHLSNRTRGDFVVTGVSVSCGCVDLKPLPFVVPPAGATALLLVSTENLKAGAHDLTVEFHLDRPTRPVRADFSISVATRTPTPAPRSDDELKPVPVESVSRQVPVQGASR